MADELKPCPFCGGAAVVGCEFGMTRMHYHGQCKGCGARGPSFPEDEGGSPAAVSAWNNRTSGVGAAPAIDQHNPAPGWYWVSVDGAAPVPTRIWREFDNIPSSRLLYVPHGTFAPKDPGDWRHTRECHVPEERDAALRIVAPIAGVNAVEVPSSERAAFEAWYLKRDPLGRLPLGVEWNGSTYAMPEGWVSTPAADRFISQWEAWNGRAVDGMKEAGNGSV